MIGDSLKIESWLLAYLMLSKAMTELFIITETLFAFSLVILTYMFTEIFGFKGVSISYLINYAIYCIVMVFFVFKIIRKSS